MHAHPSLWQAADSSSGAQGYGPDRRVLPLKHRTTSMPRKHACKQACSSLLFACLLALRSSSSMLAKLAEGGASMPRKQCLRSAWMQPYGPGCRRAKPTATEVRTHS